MLSSPSVRGTASPPQQRRLVSDLLEAERLDAHQQHPQAGRERAGRVGRQKVLAVLGQLAHHLRGVLLRDRVGPPQVDDRLGEVPLGKEGEVIVYCWRVRKGQFYLCFRSL